MDIATRRRMLGFTLLPALAAISPLVVLPFVARNVGPEGWASALAGEAVGTFAAIALAFGWTTIGPALVAVASDPRRGELYREALVIRLLTASIALPVAAVICWFVASDGYGLLSVLMGLQGALIALSYTWFAVGVGDPWSIALFDALPRVAAAVISALAIGLVGAPVEIYPLTGIAVTVIGTTAYTARILGRFPAAWPVRSPVPALFRSNTPVAATEAVMGFYTSVPVPLVNVVDPTTAAGFASADKMVKLGQFLPLTLANALQYWTAEVYERARARRLRIALTLHTVMGVLGWIVLGGLGTLVSAVLFGEAAAAPMGIVVVLGFAFACFAIRTSMIRHFLFPTQAARAVLTATLVGSALGVPLMVILTVLIGPFGAAVGYATTEAVSTVWLIPRTRRAYRELIAVGASGPETPASPGPHGRMSS